MFARIMRFPKLVVVAVSTWAAIYLAGCAPAEMPAPDHYPCVQFLGLEPVTETEQPVRLAEGADMQDVAFPMVCREAGIQGTVEVDFIVNENGVPDSVEIVRGIDAGCDEAAHQAVRTTEFRAAADEHGNLVPARTRARFEFQLRCREIIDPLSFVSTPDGLRIVTDE